MPASGDTASVPLFAHADARALNRAPRAEPTATATRAVGAEELSSPVATAPPLGATQSAAAAATTTAASAPCTPQVHPAGSVAAEITVDAIAGFHPFPPPAELPQLSPMTCPEDHDGGTAQPQEPRRRCDRGSTDSFTRDSPSFDGRDTEEDDGLETSPLRQPSPHAIATAFTPLRQSGKIERTKELMERVALVKAQFRARQLAAATGGGQCTGD
jgi:hypothetical protein